MDTATATIIDTRATPITRRPEQPQQNLTAASIVAWVDNDDRDAIVRWSVYLESALNLTSDQLDEVCRGATGLCWTNPPKGEKRQRTANYKTVANRGSLLRVAHGAITQCLLMQSDLESIGVNAAYDMAVAALSKASTDWRGNKVDAESVKKQAERKATAKAVAAMIEEGTDPQQAIAKAAERVAADQEKSRTDKALKLVEAMFKKLADMGYTSDDALALVAQVAGVEVAEVDAE